MKIAVIGSGNVGGTLAKQFIKAGHTVMMGVKFPLSEKSVHLASEIGEDRFTSPVFAAQQSDIIILATPAPLATEVAQKLGDTTGKIIIDTMNIVLGKGPEGFNNTADAILANTATRDVVKCFNTTGFENMANPVHNGQGIDMFVAGDSAPGKEAATRLAKDIGFGNVYDFGGNDKFYLLEQLGNCWINLAIFQKNGRDTYFKLIHR